MPRTKTTDNKATEAATFRFTRTEKRLLEFMARQESLTLTDLIRQMIAERASKLDSPPSLEETPIRRRPGRPRKTAIQNNRAIPAERMDSVPMAAAEEKGSVSISRASTGTPREADIPVSTKPLQRPAPSARVSAPPPQSWAPPPPEVLPISTFGELTIAFRRHFSGRAEGTRGEFEETIVFLLENFSPDQLLTTETPLSDIDLARLTLIRDRIKVADIRFPRKNLYLTYIRMMLQFALKRDDCELNVTPGQDLPPFTAKEIADAWPLSMKSP